jgi:hypothetical protein
MDVFGNRLIGCFMDIFGKTLCDGHDDILQFKFRVPECNVIEPGCLELLIPHPDEEDQMLPFEAIWR